MLYAEANRRVSNWLASSGANQLSFRDVQEFLTSVTKEVLSSGH